MTIRTLFSVLLLLVVGVAEGSFPVPARWPYGGGNPEFSSRGAYCSYREQFDGTPYNYSLNGVTDGTGISGADGGSCDYRNNVEPFDISSVGAPGELLSCPVNSTGTSECSCNSGWYEYQNACQSTPPPPPPASCTAGQQYSASGLAKAALGDWCIGGCLTWMYGRAGDGSAGGKYSYAGQQTGATCTGSGLPAAATSTCGEGQCQGTVNGATTCLPCGVPGTTTEKTAEKKTTNADGTSTKETVTTGSAPGGGSSGGGGGAPGSSTRTITTYDANGNPTGTVTKEGAETPETDFCSEHPDTFGCLQVGEPNVAAGQDLITQERGPSTITPVGGFSTGSCPADIALPRGMSFSFEPMCTAADALRPVVLALAWLSAGLIVVGGLKNE